MQPSSQGGRPAPGRSALIPETARRPSDDPIFALNAEARRRAAAGEPILNATLGALLRDDGRLAVLPSVTDALLGVPPEAAAAYAPIAGDPAFLEAVVGDLFGDGPLAERAVATATPGGTGAVHHAFRNFLEPGQAVLSPSYYWGPYDVIAAHAGRSVAVFEMFGEDRALDLEGFRAGLDRMLEEQGRALAVFNFPCNNPTGYSLDGPEWEAVGEIVRRAGEKGPVAFLLDAAYETFGPKRDGGWRSAVPAMLETATVLVAWTASKAFAQYGARVGALVALHDDPPERARLRAALNYSCRATWSNCNHMGLLAVTELLTDPELRRRSTAERGDLIRLLGQRVEAFNEGARTRGLAHPRYDGGFFVAVFTPDGPRTAAAMREAGVFVVPMRGAVRVALCSTPASAVPRLVEALTEGVAAAP